jgi:hypothetical protein
MREPPTAALVAHQSLRVPISLQPIREAGLVFHGLRKSAVVTLLEARCSDAEVERFLGSPGS